MPNYSAYGLVIYSDLPFPELPATTPNKIPDVIIQKGKINWEPHRSGPTDSCCRITAKHVYFFWGHIGKVLIANGQTIVVDPCPGVPEAVIRLPILGVAFAALLHQRGQLALHASAVVVNGKAIAFLGDTGWGKSTLAAALHARGHQLLCDDVVALDFTEREITVLPAFPQLKLWPDALETMGVVPDHLPRLSTQVEKRRRPISDGFSYHPVPLGAIYILGMGPVLQIQRLSQSEAMVALIRNSHAALSRQLAYWGKAVHFRQCTDLAKQVPIYSLKRPKNLTLLSAVAELVEYNGHPAGV
ncbi:MAG: hypothetical protein KDI79_10960 [Anaerolineae bacterium]|nr:hypothetical protein [Anaerolineae bacterium]